MGAGQSRQADKISTNSLSTKEVENDLFEPKPLFEYQS